VFSLVPVFGMFMLCTKMIGLAPIVGFQHQDVFPETDWSEFFLNTKVTDARANRTVRRPGGSIERP